MNTLNKLIVLSLSRTIACLTKIASKYGDAPSDSSRILS